MLTLLYTKKDPDVNTILDIATRKDLAKLDRITNDSVRDVLQIRGLRFQHFALSITDIDRFIKGATITGSKSVEVTRYPVLIFVDTWGRVEIFYLSDVVRQTQPKTTEADEFLLADEIEENFLRGDE